VFFSYGPNTASCPPGGLYFNTINYHKILYPRGSTNGVHGSWFAFDFPFSFIFSFLFSPFDKSHSTSYKLYVLKIIIIILESDKYLYTLFFLNAKIDSNNNNNNNIYLRELTSLSKTHIALGIYLLTSVKQFMNLKSYIILYINKYYYINRHWEKRCHITSRRFCTYVIYGSKMKCNWFDNHARAAQYIADDRIERVSSDISRMRHVVTNICVLYFWRTDVRCKSWELEDSVEIRQRSDRIEVNDDRKQCENTAIATFCNHDIESHAGR
jgi:hypothetical protein